MRFRISDTRTRFPFGCSRYAEIQAMASPREPGSGRRLSDWRGSASQIEGGSLQPRHDSADDYPELVTECPLSHFLERAPRSSS